MVENIQETEVQKQDVTATEILQQEVDKIESGLLQYREMRNDAEKDLENYSEQAALLKRVREIQLNGLVKKPEHIQYEYEDSEEFWTLQRKLVGYKHKQENLLDESKIKGYTEQIKQATTLIEENEAKLAELKAGDSQ